MFQYFRFLVTLCVRFGISPFVPKLKRRIEFELSNLNEFAAQRGILPKKCMAFEVSSQGELEQVMPLIHFYIETDYKVEILFSSPSVLKDLENLKQTFSQNVSIHQLPLITFAPKVFCKLWSGFQNIETFIRSNKLIMCRYDFFPELLELAFKRRGVLLEASLIGKKMTPLEESYYRVVYTCFDQLYPSCKKDRFRIAKLFSLYDDELKGLIQSPLGLRALQIQKRQSSKVDKYNCFINVKSALEKNKNKPSFIIGSAWQEDLFIFEDQSLVETMIQDNVTAWIAPHCLDSESVQKMELFMNKCLGPYNRQIEVISNKDQSISSNIVLLTIPGLLCELYSDFDLAYVGGGFGRSIHSVLEPYVGGAKIICGPKIYRSTEAEQILDETPERMHVINFQKNNNWEKFVKTNWQSNDNWHFDSLTLKARMKEMAQRIEQL